MVPSRIKMVPTQNIEDDAALLRYEQKMLAEGYEGVMVRDPAQPYKFGRSYPKDGTLLKVKRFVDFEAEVIGVYEQMHNGNEATTNLLGRTERSSRADGKTGMGVLGGLQLRALNGPWAGTEFRCGTGFDAEQRSVACGVARRRILAHRPERARCQDQGPRSRGEGQASLPGLPRLARGLRPMSYPSIFEIERAQERADSLVVSTLNSTIANIDAMNFGQARERLEYLLRILPHDHGAQTFRPLFEVKLAEVMGIEPNIHDADMVAGAEPY
jgi:hypothetical protein